MMQCIASPWLRFEQIFVGRLFQSHWPSFLKSPMGHRMQLDGHCSELQLAFEHHGQQHYVTNHFFHLRRKSSFEEQLGRDRLKVLQCEAAGVRLVVVPIFVKDLWTFIRASLLRWYGVGDVFPVQLQTVKSWPQGKGPEVLVGCRQSCYGTTLLHARDDSA